MLTDPQRYTHLCDAEDRVQDEVEQQMEDIYCISEADMDEDEYNVEGGAGGGPPMVTKIKIRL